jgi:aspartyl-tRNA(Asn)/glutamyl-tRNA(Gln) amidotransferase subunit A
MSDAVFRLGAHEIADLVRSGELSSKEVLEVFLERIEAFNPELNAFVFLDFERARAQASEIDRRIASREDPGPLTGVPIGVKDLEDVAGMPTTHGSVIHKDNVPSTNSLMVDRLLAAGCIVVGKTAAPEFGAANFTSTRLHGTTRNPWNPARTPGGSSGGSAAAVASAMIPICTASDGGGSTRIPASYSGLFGPKGTFGRVARGRSPESSFTSVHGPISRSVRSAARFYDCVIGPDESDMFSLPHPGISYEKEIEQRPAGLRAAWSADLGFGVCSGEVASIAKRAADTFSEAGGLEWVDRPVELEETSRAWRYLGAPESWLRHSPYWPEREADLEPIIARGVRATESMPIPDFAEAIRRRFENNQRLAEIFREIDVIVTPTTPTTAFAAEGPAPKEIDGQKIREMHSLCFTYPFNVSGHPAVSVPCGFDSEGLPVGLQFVGRRHSDHVLIALAASFESVQPWPRIAPAYNR